MKKRFNPSDSLLRKSYQHWLLTYGDVIDNDIIDTHKYWEWLKNTYRVYYLCGDNLTTPFTPYQLAAEEHDWLLFLMRWS